MRVFVTGTGRCGTVTFSRACRHIKNYTSGHESKAGVADERLLDWPDDHIEVDPHIAWYLPLLIDRYPHAFYVHLRRNCDGVAASWIRRGSSLTRGANPLINVMFQTDTDRMSQRQHHKSARWLCDCINAQIDASLSRVTSTAASMRATIDIENPRDDFARFFARIGAEGDLSRCLDEFSIRHNAS